MQKIIVGYVDKENHFPVDLMVEKLDSGFTPVEVCIMKWDTILRLLREDRVADALETEGGKSNCAFCYLYKCKDCPIKTYLLKTHKGLVRGKGCLHTPYVQLSECFWYLIGLKNTHHPDRKYWTDKAIENIKLGLEMLYKIKEDLKCKE